MSFRVILAFLLLSFSSVSECAFVHQSKSAPALKKAAKDVRVLERRGSFVIKPDTRFCLAATADPKIKAIMRTYYRGPGIDGEQLSHKFFEIGQSDYLNGTGRVGWSQDKKCPDDGNNIYVNGQANLNAKGKPYRLVLEARQGSVDNAESALAKVEIVRPDGQLPGLILFTPDGEGFLSDAAIRDIATQNSIPEDSKILSQRLLDIIFSKQKES